MRGGGGVHSLLLCIVHLKQTQIADVGTAGGVCESPGPDVLSCLVPTLVRKIKKVNKPTSRKDKVNQARGFSTGLAPSQRNLWLKHCSAVEEMPACCWHARGAGMLTVMACSRWAPVCVIVLGKGSATRDVLHAPQGLHVPRAPTQEPHGRPPSTASGSTHSALHSEDIIALGDGCLGLQRGLF